jgi:hypothetical protein
MPQKEHEKILPKSGNKLIGTMPYNSSSVAVRGRMLVLRKHLIKSNEI